MSSQTIYFNNPADITTLQTQVSALQNDAGYGQSLSSSVNTNVDSFLNDLVSEGQFGAFLYGGNVKTGQEVFRAAGVMNPQGGVYSTGALVNWSSAGKPITGLVCAKMIEEMIIDPSDKVSSYIPHFRGTGTYWDTLSVTNPSTFPLDPSSYTGTIGTFQWENISINDLIHFNVGLMTDAFVTPCWGHYYYNSEAVSNAINDGSVYALATLVQASNFTRALVGDYTANLAGLTGAIGISTTSFNSGRGGGYLSVLGGTGGNYIRNAIGFTLKDGSSALGTTSWVNPLIYKPGVVSNDIKPWKISVTPATYDTAYAFLNAVAEYALVKYAPGTYTFGSAFATYATNKIFTPLGMSNSYIQLQQTMPAFYTGAGSNTANVNLWASTSFKRSPQLGMAGVFNLADKTTWLSLGCATGYQSIAGSASGPLVWVDNYLPTSTIPSNDPNNLDFVARAAFGYTRSTNLNSIGSPCFALASPLTSSIGDFGKLLKCLANKGLGPNGTRIIKTETWNYLISPKCVTIIPQTPVVPYPYSVDPSYGNQSFCLGMSRFNRDLTNETSYGFDDTTIQWVGAAGSAFYIDFYTGNWFCYAMPQSAFSSGLIPIEGTGLTPGFNSLYRMSRALKKMIA